jgi:hypothetical protein
MSTNIIPYKTEVDVEFGSLKEIVQWCQYNCERDWHYDMINIPGTSPGRYEFQFDDEKDFVKFIMWKK